MNETDSPPLVAVPPDGAVNVQEYSVSELSFALKRTVEQGFGFVRVRGELTGVKRHTSGHIYLDLKDDKAVLAGVIWRGQAGRLRVEPQNGLEVVATGKLTTYPGQSKYQIVIEQLQLAGLGALMQMLEQRKKKLAAEGLFDAARKKPLPYLPEVIGVVTSPTGAVIRDILHRLADRFPRRVIVWPVAVQGERASGEIANAIHGFNAFQPGGRLPRPDVIIVARGGGSMEDLMPFNEENVVRAAAESRIPLISAVGHETDTTLIDFASDRRAPTPTAAAEMAVPVRANLIAQTLDLEGRLVRAAQRHLEQRRMRLRDLARALPRPADVVGVARQRLDNASARLGAALSSFAERLHRRFGAVAALVRPQAVRIGIERGRTRLADLDRRRVLALTRRLADERRTLANAGKLLETLGHQATLERGFALVRGGDGRLRRRAAEIGSGEALRIEFADGAVPAVAGEAAASPESAPKPKKRSKSVSGPQGKLF